MGNPTILEKFILPNTGLDLPIYHLDPYSLTSETKEVIERIEKGGVNRILTRRYQNIELVKNAEVIGILIGTVVVDNYI